MFVYQGGTILFFLSRLKSEMSLNYITLCGEGKRRTEVYYGEEEEEGGRAFRINKCVHVFYSLKGVTPRGL